MFDEEDWYGDEGDCYAEEREQEQEEIRKYHKKALSLISDDLLLLKYQTEARHSDIINKIVPENSFPAFDIAMKIKANGWKPSANQREALENVLAYYYTIH